VQDSKGIFIAYLFLFALIHINLLIARILVYKKRAAKCSPLNIF